MFEEFIARWGLIPAGEPVVRLSSDLLPVTWRGRPAMLKIARIEEEARGGRLMAWWAGEGAAPVFEQEGAAILVERDGASLEGMAHASDDDAIRIACDVAGRLHRPRQAPPPGLLPLKQWFRALEQAAPHSVLADCASIAADLLASPKDVTPLHGDIHHGNILDFGAGGWLAIDPKGLIGERAFDFANLFFNPTQAIAERQFDRRLKLVSELASIEPVRLLEWVAAWAGLSAAFAIEDGDPPEDALAIAGIATARLP